MGQRLHLAGFGNDQPLGGTAMRRANNSQNVVLGILIGLILVGLFSCQADTSDGPSGSLVYDETSSSLSQRMVRKLGNDLRDETYAVEHVTLIQEGALNRVAQEGVADSTDISLVAPAVLIGAQLAVTNAEIGLTTSTLRLAAINLILTSVMSSLNGNVSSQTSSLILDHTNAKRMMSLADAYKNVIRLLVETSIRNLDEAGIPPGDIATAVEGVTQTVITNLNAAGVPSETIDQVTNSVVTTAIASIDDTGISSQEYQVVISKTIQGAFNGLSALGRSADQISSTAAGLAEAAVLGLDNVSGVTSTNIDTFISSVKTAVEEGYKLVLHTDTVPSSIADAIQAIVTTARSSLFSNDPSIWGKARWGTFQWKTGS